MDGDNYVTKALSKTVTGQAFTVVHNLRACESYSFLVAVSKPGRCPPSRQRKTMQTGEGKVTSILLIENCIYLYQCCLEISQCLQCHLKKANIFRCITSDLKIVLLSYIITM